MNVISESERERIIVYEETPDACLEVSQKDIFEYSKKLGIDLGKNPSLATSIKDWINQPLPRYWFPCYDTQTCQWFYCNSLNGQSSWEHPLEEIHRNLAKQYCQTGSSLSISQNYFSSHIGDILSTERENPEGESAEPSMEAGVNSKDSFSLMPSYLDGIPTLKSQLPRTLAPLKRIPSTESITSLKPKPSLLPPITSSLRNENVREVSFTTFKSPDPVSSLLPSDQLFDSSNRPTVGNNSVLSSVILGPRGISSSKKDVIHQDEKETKPQLASVVLPGKSRSNLLESIPPIARKAVVEEQITDFGSKPSTGLSFTEKLAAKRNVSRKIGDPDSRPASSIGPDISDALNDKKHVQFDLESKHIRHYTPECSEETKITESSNSSEDFLDFIGDPQLLQPLSELTYKLPMAFEEKRWDVSLTSFGLTNSNNSSPVKVMPTVTIHPSHSENDEMVTKFNSEYCPSPLSVTSEGDVRMEPSSEISSPQNQTPVPDERNETDSLGKVLQLDIVSNIPAAVKAKSLPVKEEYKSQISPSSSQNTSPLPQSPEHKISSCVTTQPAPESRQLSPLPIKESSEAEEKSTRVSQVVDSTEMIREDQKLSNDQPVEFGKSDRLGTLARGAPRVESIEDPDSPVLSSAVKDIPDANQHSQCNSLREPANELSNPSNRTENVNVTNLDTDSISSHVDLATPPALKKSLFEDIAHDQIEPEQEITEKATPSVNEEKNAATSPLQQLAPQDLLRMKEEMHAALEKEKKRLEHWFSQEIAQLKSSNLQMVQQFESELANERRRTEDLSKLVENAKEEKEDLTRREILRLEETLALLVEEKNRQVQSQLSADVSVSAAPASQSIQQHQDVHVQTEEAKSVPPEIKGKDDVLDHELNLPVNEHCQYNTESHMSTEKREARKKCHCDTLQRQVARVEREMQLLKQKNIAFQKSSSPAGRTKRSAPVKAKRESWWVDSDESTTSTVSSVSERRFSKARSRSLTNLHAAREVINGRKSASSHRGHDLHNRSRSHRKSWMDDLSDQSDAPTSGVSSAFSTGEWDTVLNSINKISGDLREVWSHIGQRPRSLSCLPSKNLAWMSTAPPLPAAYSSHSTPNHMPLHWSLSGSTAERTQALRLWLQQNNQHSQHFF